MISKKKNKKKNCKYAGIFAVLGAADLAELMLFSIVLLNKKISSLIDEQRIRFYSSAISNICLPRKLEIVGRNIYLQNIMA